MRLLLRILILYNLISFTCLVVFFGPFHIVGRIVSVEDAGALCLSSSIFTQPATVWDLDTRASQALSTLAIRHRDLMIEHTICTLYRRQVPR